MKTSRLTALLVGLVSIPALAAAQAATSSDELKNARDEVREATTVVKTIQSQPEAAKLLDQAKGVFLVPDYGRAALGVGGAGGQGVLVVRNGGDWSGPAFYNVGSISLGVQAGASAGHVAMFLMTDKAVQQFRENPSFSLDADAELTIVNYSARGQASAGKGDVVFWSDVEGGFAGGALSASAITADKDANAAFYGMSAADAATILSGTAANATHPEVSALKTALNA